MSAGVPALYVVTGGPGAGKTTLIEALAAAGYATIEEAGRAIIRAEAAAGGPALPWGDAAAYAEAMTRRDAEAHQRVADAKRPIFFDRGLPDVIGYRRLEGLPVPDTLQSLCRDRRYHPRVFIAPPWPEIYANDAERRQSLAEAERTYRMMREVYLEFGYELLELPRVSVGERVAFVQRQLRP